MAFALVYQTMRMNGVESEVQQALREFTGRYSDAFREKHGTLPASEALYGVPSPCIVTSLQESVLWQPAPFNGEPRLNGVEKALDILLQPTVHAFYTTQFAGDMPARFDGMALTLLQVWSEDDLVRLQENLIGHLVTQKRRKLSPTLFIATLEEETEVISVCNLTGEVLHEKLGAKQRTRLSPSLALFLSSLTPDV